MTRYVECKEDEIPAGVRFDVPRRHQGQIVEVAYGGIGCASEYDEGDPYKRVTDQSMPIGKQTTYYKLAPKAFAKQDTIDRIIDGGIGTKTWRSACERECLPYVTAKERKALSAYVRERYDAAGAGFSGRWQERGEGEP